MSKRTSKPRKSRYAVTPVDMTAEYETYAQCEAERQEAERVKASRPAEVKRESFLDFFQGTLRPF